MMTIQEWISELEEEDMGLNEFYSKLLAAKQEIEDRLALAEGDGVDLDNLDEDDEP